MQYCSGGPGAAPRELGIRLGISPSAPKVRPGRGTICLPMPYLIAQATKVGPSMPCGYPRVSLGT